MYRVVYINQYNKESKEYFHDELEALMFFAERVRDVEDQPGGHRRQNRPSLDKAKWITLVDRYRLEADV